MEGKRLKRFKTVLSLLVAMMVVFAIPSSAFAASESNFYLDINSAPSYCGYSYASIDNYPGSQGPLGETDALHDPGTGSICYSFDPGIPGLAANSVTVRATLRCQNFAGQTEWQAWDSGVKGNLAGRAKINVTASGNLCGTGVGAGYPHARTVVTSQWWIYGVGYVTAQHTTHWMTTA